MVADRNSPILELNDLTVGIGSERGVFNAVDSLTLSINQGEVLGLVGESGCGKSITALAIMGLLSAPTVRVTRGHIRFAGQDLVALSNKQRRLLRGDQIGMIFQEPMTSLNPVYTIGDQLVEAYRTHRQASRSDAWREAVSMLDRVGIPGAASRARNYPHELSGGMRQRVMIAMALICGPDLLIADEPTTALDVSTQAQILDLILALRRDFGMAILMITQDLGVAAEVADRAAVMYAGRLVEEAPVRALFQAPTHPYTHALLGSMPRLDVEAERLTAIQGSVAPPFARPSGCSFRDRCPRAQSRCGDAVPSLDSIEANHTARCYFPIRDHQMPAEGAH